jgi:hypothetical protein
MERNFETALEAVDIHTQMRVAIRAQWQRKNRMSKEYTEIQALLTNVRRMIDDLSVLEVTHRKYEGKHNHYTKKAVEFKRQEIINAMNFIDKMNFFLQLSI